MSCGLDRDSSDWRLTPELVAAAEGFAEQVIYVPVSATGRGPEVDSRTGAFGFRPRDIAPIWAEVPLLYALSKWTQAIVPYLAHKALRPATGLTGENGYAFPPPKGDAFPPIRRDAFPPTRGPA